MTRWSPFSTSRPPPYTIQLDVTHRKGVGGVERVFVAMHIPPAGLGVSTYVEGSKVERFESGSRSLME